MSWYANHNPSPYSCRLVVVNYLHFVRAALRPNETNAVLIVDTNAMLPLPVTGQSLKPVAWWYSQLIE